MKYFAVIVALCCSFGTVLAQTEKEEEIQIITPNSLQSGEGQEDPIFKIVEEPPLFGDATTVEESEKNLAEYIAEALEKEGVKKPGVAYVTFTIEKDGTMTGFRVLYGKDQKFNDVALKIAKNLPQWKPGKQRGKAIRFQQNIQVKKR